VLGLRFGTMLSSLIPSTNRYNVAPTCFPYIPGGVTSRLSVLLLASILCAAASVRAGCVPGLFSNIRPLAKNATL
jgi:hypothetical protein